MSLAWVQTNKQTNSVTETGTFKRYALDLPG